MKYLYLIFLLFSLHIFGQDEVVSDISFGPVVLGENRIDLKSDDFQVVHKKHYSNLSVRSNLLDDTLQWVRTNGVLLSPRMKLRIELNVQSGDIFLKHNSNTIFPVWKDKKMVTEISVGLFLPNKIDIFYKDVNVHTLYVKPAEKIKGQRHLIDYSCAPYNLQLTGFDDDYLSVGCYLNKAGKIGHERGFLEVQMISPTLFTSNKSSAPFFFNLYSKSISKATFVDDKGKEKQVRVSATISERAHRLKTAVGFGPYSFTTRYEGHGASTNITSPIMLYGKFDMTLKTSLRAFDALFYDKNFFNNFGLYFAYDVGEAFDKRFIATPLLGIQAITHKSKFRNGNYSKIIYPQGIEFLYRHAFGKKNLNIVYGMFFSPSSEENYKNVWVRAGKKIFYELNYFSWKEGARYSKAYGFSLGIPLAQFF